MHAGNRVCGFMDTGSILIVGRGQSAYDFDWSSVDCPVMAVSSGIFAIPPTVKVDHFVTLDEPKCYMAQITPGITNSWNDDPQARPWKFWTDPAIVKHVVAKRIRTVDFVPIPFREIMASMREWADANKPDCDRTGVGFNELRDAFYEAFGESGIGQFGFQPGWGDCPNVRGWETKAYRYPKWTGDGPLACWKSKDTPDGFLYNSLIAAVQIATRLGYKRLKFIGVDLLPETGYGDTLALVMEAWHKHAVKAGYEWINLSPVSRLREFVPSIPTQDEAANVVAQAALDSVIADKFGGRATRIVPFCENGVMGFDIVPAEEVAA